MVLRLSQGFQFGKQDEDIPNAEKSKKRLVEARDSLKENLIEAKEDGNERIQSECLVNLGVIYQELADIEIDEEAAAEYGNRAGNLFQSAGILLSNGQNGYEAKPVQQSAGGDSEGINLDNLIREPQSSFADDVMGYDDLKNSIIMDYIGPFAFRDLHIEKGGRIPRGFVLHGYSGTGKSTIAEAFADKLNKVHDDEVSFISAGTDVLKDSKIGESSKQVKRCFRKAREIEPAVLFLDEIDAIAPSRTGRQQMTEEVKDMTNRLLIELSQLDKSEDVVIVGTTNLISEVDPAIIQDHRLDTIEVPLPDEDDRSEILEHYLDRGDPDWKNIDIDNWVERTDGFPGSAIQALVETAGNRAAAIQRENSDKDVKVNDLYLEQAWKDRDYEDKYGTSDE